MQQKLRQYKINVSHPAFEEEKNQEYVLNERVEEDGSLIYCLDVESVICIDHICKIVPVRMYWNHLGQYKHFLLEEGIILEKGKGEPFSDGDYLMLHSILEDQNSPYRNVTYSQITKEKVLGEGELDAISGATAVMLSSENTIEGAAWTCFTLWHWANGNVVQKIRKVSGAYWSEKELLEFAMSEDYQVINYVIEELMRRKNYSPRMIESVVASTLSNQLYCMKMTISYLESAPDSLYEKYMMQLYIQSNSNFRIRLLQSIQAHIDLFRTFQPLITRISELHNYQEIDLILEIFGDVNTHSEAISEEVFSLLNHENNLIQRRAYWFLSKRKLTVNKQSELEDFYSINKDWL